MEVDLEHRRCAFGSNDIPMKLPKSFLKLALETFHDTILIILIIAAVVSFCLAFYHPPASEDKGIYLVMAKEWNH